MMKMMFRSAAKADNEILRVINVTSSLILPIKDSGWKWIKLEYNLHAALIVCKYN